MIGGIQFSSGADLRACRHYAGWTQSELARRSGIHVQTVKYHEKRKGPFSGSAPRLFQSVLLAAGAWPVRLEDEGGQTAEKKACGAKTRSGTPCKLMPLSGKARCKLHGGKSTGPTTADGRDRIRAAQHKRWGRRIAGLNLIKINQSGKTA